MSGLLKLQKIMRCATKKKKALLTFEFSAL